MKKKIVAVLTAGCMALSLSACGSGETSQGENEKEKITFVLDWTPNTNQYRPLCGAGKKDIFEDEGTGMWKLYSRRRMARMRWLLRERLSSGFPSRIRWRRVL